jgi:hypothetical protein
MAGGAWPKGQRSWVVSVLAPAHLQGKREAAGEGFEPSLTDPELILLGSPLFAGVPEIVYPS